MYLAWFLSNVLDWPLPMSLPLERIPNPLVGSVLWEPSQLEMFSSLSAMRTTRCALRNAWSALSTDMGITVFSGTTLFTPLLKPSQLSLSTLITGLQFRLERRRIDHYINHVDCQDIIITISSQALLHSSCGAQAVVYRIQCFISFWWTSLVTS